MYYIIGRVSEKVLKSFNTEKEAQDWLDIDDRYLFWYLEKR